MKKLNCLIVDDEPLARKGIKSFIEKLDYLHCAGEARNVSEALMALESRPFDIVFLDIEMPGKKGFDMLEHLPERPAIIFTTAFPNYAVKGFDLDVQDYLLKPISFERFQRGVRKALEYLRTQNDQRNLADTSYVFLRSEGKLHKLLLHEILYIQAMQNYVQCHTASQRFISHITMKAMEEQLPEDQFVRIHKSYLVNKENISRIDGVTVEIDGQKLPISRNYKEQAFKRILKDQLISR